MLFFIFFSILLPSSMPFFYLSMSRTGTLPSHSLHSIPVSASLLASCLTRRLACFCCFVSTAGLLPAVAAMLPEFGRHDRLQTVLWAQKTSKRDPSKFVGKKRCPEGLQVVCPNKAKRLGLLKRSLRHALSEQ